MSYVPQLQALVAAFNMRCEVQVTVWVNKTLTHQSRVFLLTM